ncbi:MAG: GIY-YIG nuclease family protein [Candidatus Blackburnbacteria bacterium]|nr:GIY-YIG nuclease family protein [Candidatus Blackburnbacteria bacterium]
MWYVYILECSDKRTYIGCTNNLRDRILRHQNGYVAATKERLPIRLMAYFAIRNKEKAFKFEQYLKTGSGRTFLSKRLFA